MVTHTKLTLKATLSKHHFALDEPINVTVDLVNISAQPITVNKRMAINNRHAVAAFRELSFIVTTAGGETLPFLLKINVGFTTDSDFGLLNPGESVNVQTTLSDAFEFNLAGTYSLMAVYENQSEPKHGAAWKGVIESAPVIFAVG
jgi:hypothetical protein